MNRRTGSFPSQCSVRRAAAGGGIGCLITYVNTLGRKGNLAISVRDRYRMPEITREGLKEIPYQTIAKIQKTLWAVWEPPGPAAVMKQMGSSKPG
jgi:hypothetical protein